MTKPENTAHPPGGAFRRFNHHLADALLLSPVFLILQEFCVKKMGTLCTKPGL